MKAWEKQPREGKADAFPTALSGAGWGAAHLWATSNPHWSDVTCDSPGVWAELAQCTSCVHATLPRAYNRWIIFTLGCSPTSLLELWSLQILLEHWPGCQELPLLTSTSTSPSSPATGTSSPGQNGETTHPKPCCCPQTQPLQTQPNKTSFNSIRQAQPITTCLNLSQQENFLPG